MCVKCLTYMKKSNSKIKLSAKIAKFKQVLVNCLHSLSLFCLRLEVNVLFRQLEAISRCNSVSEPKRSQHHRSGSLDSQTTPRADCNPWSLRLHNSHLEKMSKNSSQSFSEFIVINLLDSCVTVVCV